MSSAIRWFVPKRSKTAHAYLKSLGNGNVEFWCGTVRDQYEIRFPRKGERRCKDCIAHIRNGRRAGGKEQTRAR